MSERSEGTARRLVRRHPGLTLVALPCAILATLASLLWFPGAPAGTGPGSLGVAAVRQNRPAPNFDLPRLSGPRRLSLDSLRGDVVVVNFWASWCAACQREASSLQQLSSRYRGTEVHFVGIDHGDRSSSAREFVRRNGITYPSVVDQSGDLLGKYGTIGIPTTYVIDRGGRIRYQVIGTVDAATLRRCVDRVRAGGAR